MYCRIPQRFDDYNPYPNGMLNVEVLLEITMVFSHPQKTLRLPGLVNVYIKRM